MSDLTHLFTPRGVAVIGASRDPNKLGYSVVNKLLHAKYRGAIYPVNPKAEAVLGLDSYASIKDVPDPLDLAVIIVPARFVPTVLAETVERKVPNAVIISGGFRETGAAGAALEEELKRIVAGGETRVVGPNCVGIISTHTPINATFLPEMPEPGEIGFLSHSGALCAAVIDWARHAGVGFSRIVSLGNQLDLTQTDMLETFVNDPDSRVITMYLEGMDDGPAFIAAAREVALKQPLLAIKGGATASGAKAVSSHTGALSGQDEAYSAAFRKAGVQRADTMEEMFNWARAMAWQPLPKGNRVGVLTNAGGLGILATDAIEAAGLQLAELTEETKAFMRERTPPAAAVDNPVDVLGGSGSATYGLAMDALLRDPNVDVVCVIQAPADWFSAPSLAEVVGEIAGYAKKPVLACMMGLAPGSEAARVLNKRHIPNYTFPEQLGSTLAAMWQRTQWLQAQAERAGDTYAPPQRDLDAAAAALDGQSGLLAPDRAEQLMAAYGIPTPAGTLAPDAAAAVKAADTIGYPVVLKIASPDIIHKTDIGGVAVGLEDAATVEAAAASMLARAAEAQPDADLLGVHVQAMIGGCLEMITGVTRDPQFGPLVMVGSGGTAVELTRDVAFDLAPLTPHEADTMLDRTTVGALLRGHRGAKPCSREAALDIVIRLAQLAVDFPQIAEIEINPVLVQPDDQGASAVDVRVIVG